MILCIQSALPKVGLALVDIETAQVLAEKSWESERNEADKIMSEINDLLETLKKTPSDIQKVIVVTGPGSFTAVRVGVSVANAFGYGLQIPVCGVDSFAYVAARADAPEGTPVLMSASLKDCYVAGSDSVREVIEGDEVKKEYAGKSCAGVLNAKHSEELGVKILPPKRSLGEAFLFILKRGQFNESTMQFPYYLKRPNITTPKKR